MIYIIDKASLIEQRDLVAAVDWKNGAMIDGLLHLLDILIENSEGEWSHTHPREGEVTP